MKKNIYYLNGLIILLVISSCSSRPPLWIGERPSNSEYWHGIGFAENSTETNSKTLAKEYAIHEISSQIKVNISSELDIVVTDFNGSVDNAISSVIIVGAIIAALAGTSNSIFNTSSVFGFIAIILAAINIFGGFLVTQRMLQMYKKKKDKKK